METEERLTAPTPAPAEAWITAFVTPRDFARRDPTRRESAPDTQGYYSDEPTLPYDSWDWLD